MAYPAPYGYGRPPRDGSGHRSPHGPHPAHPPSGPPQQLQRHDSVNSRGSNRGERPLSTRPQAGVDIASAIEDDSSDLLGRLHLAIPDLELLLKRYKDTHGELGLRDALERKKEAEAAEIIKQQEVRISRFMKQFQEIESKKAREISKLRLCTGKLEEHMKELEEKLQTCETQRDELALRNKDSSEQNAALVRERIVIAAAAAKERDKLVNDFEVSKSGVEEKLREERARAVELSTQLGEAKSKAETAEQQLVEMQSKMADLEQQLTTEKLSALSGWEDKSIALAAEHMEAIEALKKSHKDDLNEQTRAFVGLQECLNLRMTQENVGLLEQISNLKKAWNEDKTRFEAMIEELKGASRELDG